jgi:ATP-dependent DNA helicase RecG
VDTFCVDESYRPRLNAFIEKQIADGGQVYIVCPSVEEKEPEDSGEITLESFGIEREELPPLKAAVQFSEELAEALPSLNVAFLHGKMKGSEKDKIMKNFAEGLIDVLVSTTVIEVGVNVPRATLMIVENAERFGLAQLHQLRGRVGRGSKKSYCVLVSDLKSEASVERLKIMKETNDGFKIADEDLRLRGPGDFFGNRQHGLPQLHIADLLGDMALLQRAQAVAATCLAADPALEQAENAPLKQAVERLFTRVGEQGLN